MGSRFLEEFPWIVKMILPLFPKDTTFYATDLENFIFKDTTNFDVPFVKVGAPFAKGGPADKVIQTKQPVIMEIDESYYGVPLKVISVPAFDDDDKSKVAGVYGMAVRRENAFNLRKMADTYQKGMQEIAAAIEQTAVAASEISESEQRLNREISAISDIAAEIIKILEYIRSVADETKMLGLNAAIEAARAGDAGKGFGVVAAEIRKLSENSKETAGKIRELTRQIEEKINSALKNSEVTARATQEQAAAAEEMNAGIQELTSMLDELTRIAYEI
ncbi:methyl-accepting chemotaxis protein [Thermosyntropha sp.]|uniref:methyl-accepting chemotaxis protein n=1 Tax=Thermosyntropha sp. TaxID=2740820 RepID=UPI0025CC3BAE|nr:methyl-accepting chemotaxis protein [Thermosyntropha sp.]MBO8159572.1 methyl-accepting chemotaxis protein [Thermosyntropha sp.]